jgi:hypothetical protein
MPAWWLGSLSRARRTVLFKAVPNQAKTLLNGLILTILVGLAAVAANRLSQKTACNFQSFGYGWWA